MRIRVISPCETDLSFPFYVGHAIELHLARYSAALAGVVCCNKRDMAFKRAGFIKQRKVTDDGVSDLCRLVEVNLQEGILLLSF